MANSQITVLLEALAGGDETARDRLVPLIYEELKQMAEGQMRRERPGHTLEPTDLVNEAYLRLAQGPMKFQNRGHFFGAASEAMRRVLVDHARRRLTQKRGGGVERVTFDDLAVAVERPEFDVMELNDALTELEREDPRLCRIVELRFFSGFGVTETAESLGISPATVKRDWSYARAWLYERMSG